MFKGKAELNPETNTPVATFTETCHDDGTATMKVVLKSPIAISGTERLAIYSTIKNETAPSRMKKSSLSSRRTTHRPKSTTSKAPVPLAAVPISRISR
jgi:hypothetical protein